MQTPSTDATKKVSIAELVLTRHGVLDVAEWAIERQNAMHHAGIDHAGHCVVPQILLVDGASAFVVVALRVGAHDVIGVSTTNTGGLHAAVGCKVCWSERDALHTRRCGANLFNVCNSASSFKNGVKKERLFQTSASFELCKKTIDVMDIFWAFDFRNHDDVELVAGFCHDVDEVVEEPRRVEAIDAAPQLSGAEIKSVRHLDEASASCFLVCHRNCIFEVSENDVDVRNGVG